MPDRWRDPAFCSPGRSITNLEIGLRNLILEAQRIIATTKLPEARSERAGELLTAAVKLTDFLLLESRASILGKKGGKTTAKHDPNYFRKIPAMRKEHKGGRPPKTQ